MAGARRNLLHRNKLEDFKKWCAKRGWYQVPCIGFFEVLRMRHPMSKKPMIIFKRSGAKEHLSVPRSHVNLVMNWIEMEKNNE